MNPAADYNLSQRWPDLNLSKYFNELFRVYQSLYQAHLEQTGRPLVLARQGYETICAWILESTCNSQISGRTLQPEQAAVRSLVSNLKKSYGQDWLQSVASLLAMLMHFSAGEARQNALINHRRPQKSFSTDPTSPSVARLMGDAIAGYLLKKPIPRICPRPVDAEQYAEQALTFRVLDPSMESGQLLLEIALAIVRQVQRKHPHQSKASHYLMSALLNKLCADCLWGIDRNELAKKAVTTLFSLLGSEFGIAQLTPRHLSTGNALKHFNKRSLPLFDAIINNPPWGETLTPEERLNIRKHFSTLHHRSDTYVAFSELAIRSLQPGGVFALVLPSQFVAAQNTLRLRELLLSKTELDHMILLPRSAFAHATVRGLILLGRAQPIMKSMLCNVMTYPIVKSLGSIEPPRSTALALDALRRVGKDSWWPLFNLRNGVKPPAETVSLEQVATVTCGVQLYCKGRGDPPQTADIVSKKPFTFSRSASGRFSAVRGDDVRDFYVRDPQRFVKFGKWLARAGHHNSLRRLTRIFVRELCRRDGKLTAAVAKNGVIPLHGVLTVIPHSINLYVLVGILSSMKVAEHVRQHTASFSKVDFQKITVHELRQLPLPTAAVARSYRLALGLPPPTRSEVSLCRRLMTLTRRISRLMLRRNFLAETIRAEVEKVVAALYGDSGAGRK